MIAHTTREERRSKRNRRRIFEVDYLESRVLLTAITNPGFETGTLSDWSTSATGSCSVVTGQAHSGTYAAQLGSTSADSYIYQNVSVSPNTTYQLTAYGKMTAGTAVLSVQNYGGTQLNSNFNSSSTYSQQPLTFTTGSSTSVVTVVLYGTAGAGNAYFDDASLDPLSTAYNLGFETGTLVDWAKLATGGETVVTGQAHSGTYAVQIGSTSSDSSLNDTITGLQPNTTYVVSAWGKSTTGLGEMAVNYGINPSFTYGTANFTSTSYSQQSVTFTTDSSTTTIYIQFYRAAGSGFTYVDDVNLVQVL